MLEAAAAVLEAVRAAGAAGAAVGTRAAVGARATVGAVVKRSRRRRQRAGWGRRAWLQGYGDSDRRLPLPAGRAEARERRRICGGGRPACRR